MSRTILGNFLILLVFILASPVAQAMPPLDGVDIPQWARDERARLGVNTYPVPVRDAGRQGVVNRPGDVTLLVSGTKQFPAVCVEFPDYSSTYATASFDSMLYGPWSSGSAQDYYHEVSYNQFTVEGTVVGWYTAANNKAWYGYSNGDARAATLARATAQAADASVDYSLYDNDHDGYVDCFTCIHAGYGAEESGSGSDIWSHSWSFTGAGLTEYITNDPDPVNGGFIKINGYVIDPERSGYSNHGTMVCIGVFCHEWGHALELPDLYDVAGTGEGLGRWTIMASGSWGGSTTSPWKPVHLSAWEKMELGWLSPRAVRLRDRYSVSRVEDNSKAFWLIGRQRTFREYVLVENRDQTGFDALLYEPGLLIYHIDDSIIDRRRGSNYVNSNNSNWLYGVALEQADGQDHLYNGDNRGDANDPWPGGLNRTSFDSTSTTPNSRTNYPRAATLVTGSLVKDIPTAAPTMACTLASGVQGQFTGGPDAAGYSWIDSDTAGGPSYSWSPTFGTRLGDGDEARWQIDLPFHVPFYGGSSDSVWVSTNGWLSFGADPGTNAPANTGVPSVATPNNAVYVFWDDLNLVTSDSTGVFYRTGGSAPNRWCTITWFNARVKGVNPGNLKPVNGVTFQATVNENGSVVCQYLDCAVGDTTYNWGRSATVGIENSSGTIGLQYLYGGAPLGNLLAGERAISFTYQPSGDDVGVSRIIAPIVPIDSNQPIMPACSVYNYGSTTVSYDVRMSVGSFYERTVAVTNHTPGTSRYVTFPIYLDWQRGTHAVRCSTRLTGDGDNTNDRQVDSVTVRVLDVACQRLIAPLGAVDSGDVITPACSVYNYGSTTVTYPVRMSIGSGYVQGVSVVSHAPGTSRYVTFPDWTAEPGGTHAVRCSTRLTGDVVNANDRQLDSVSVTSDDVGVSHLLAPSGTIDSAQSVTPACSVYNYGSTTVSYDVRMTVGGFYSQTVSVAGHAPGTRRYVTFPAYSNWQRGTHAVACSTRLATDIDNTNDRLTGSVTVRVRDVGSTALLAPAGAADSGDVITPACSVYNYGSTAETYAVRMRIGSGYIQTSTVVNHLPGTSRYVTFADWVAQPVGTQSVRCSTELAGDLVETNNRASGSVTVGGVDDVGCYRIAAPAGTVDSGATVAPRAWVRNYGSGTITNLPVVFTIGASWSDTQAVTSIAPGDSAQVTFTNWVAQPGNWACACSTRLAGDHTPANDRSTGAFFVQHRDVGVVGVAVAAQLDSGASVVPVVTVRNWGNTAETADFRLTINGTGYNQTRSKLLNPTGNPDTVLFPAWTAGPRGARVLACSTLLTGDMNPANNRAAGTTFVRVLDAACLRILAPLGTVDSTGTLACRARVRNLGNTNASFPVSFTVMGGDTTTLNGNATNLAPGESTDVNFGNWTVGPRGTYRTSAGAALAGDMVPGNNTRTDSFVIRSRDVAAVAILQPPAAVDTATSVPVQAVVANYGATPENFLVFVRVGGTGYRDSTFASVAAGALDTVTLDNWTANVPRGQYPVVCSTWVAGDVNRGNDSLSRPVTVRVHDATCVQILAPSGSVDSGAVVTPWARIRNNGTGAETFPVRFTISDGYSSTRNLSLAAGLDTILTFTPWTAGVIGFFETRCTTMLAGDLRFANDLATGTIRVAGNDAGITAIIAPVGGIEPGPVVPACRVHNFGAQPRDLQAWTWIHDVNDSLVYVDSVDLAGLPADSSADLVFAEWDLPPGGYVVRCSSWTANDINPSNDTLSATCFTLVHDVGMTSIVSPLGRMDPVAVSPVVRVANFGSATEDFWNLFRIQDSLTGDVVYLDSVYTTGLEAGGTRVERFPAWSSRVGRFRHTGWTRLAADADRSNDTCRASVIVTPGAIGWEIRPDLPYGPEMKPVKQGGCLVGLETDRPRVYALKGNKSGEFYSYDVETGTWNTLPGVPDGPVERQVRRGADMCTDGSGNIYAIKGNNTLEFWRYNVVDSAWTQLPDVPAGARKLKYGSALAFISRNDSSWVYCLKGAKTFELYAYSVEGNAWLTPGTAPSGPSGKPYKSGSVMRSDGTDKLYLLKGRYNEFFVADAPTCSWVMHPPMPDYGSSGKRNKAKDGADLVWDNRGTLYGFGGGNRPFFFAFVDSANRWVELESIPHGPSGRRVKYGGSVGFLGKRVWALKGNKTNEFWSYTPDTLLFFGPRPDRSGLAEEPERLPGATGTFRVGPNPAHLEFFVRAAPDADRARVELISTLGRVERSALLLPGNSVRFDLRGLAAGAWFVRVRTATAAETRKIIISP